MPKKIIHYRKDCIGCGNCVEFAPEYWALDEEDGKANLKEGVEKRGLFWRNVNILDEEQNEKAADSCPVNVIQVR